LFEELDNKIAISSQSAGGSDTIALPRNRAIRKFMVACRYTVTDAGISAGENFQGWVNTIKIIADGKTIFEVQKNELQNVAKLLARYYSTEINDEQIHEGAVGAAMYYDGDPTTAEAQNAWYIFNMPCDLRHYDDVRAVITWDAATGEWGAASAMAATISIGLDYGNVSESIGVVRGYSGSSTYHEFSMGDFPVMRALFTGLTTDTMTKLTITGKDRMNDYNASSPIFGAACWAAHLGATASDDTTTVILTPEIFVANYPDRRAYLAVSSAAAVTAFFVVKLASVVTNEAAAKMGEVARGSAPATIIGYEDAGAGDAAKVSPAVLRDYSALQ